MLRNHHHVDLRPTAMNTALRGSGVMWLTGWVDFPSANGWSGVRGGTATPSVFQVGPGDGPSQ